MEQLTKSFHRNDLISSPMQPWEEVKEERKEAGREEDGGREGRITLGPSPVGSRSISLTV